MDYKGVLTIVGLVVFNLVAVWVLFLRGADWLEGTGLFSWQTRWWWRADAPLVSAGAFKLFAGAFLLLEVVVVIVAVIHG